MEAVLALDQGTSSTKAVLYDEHGRVLGRAARPVSCLAAGRSVTQDPQELLDSVLEAGRRVVREAGREPAVVALANQGESVLCWDPTTGGPLSAVISWQDRRATSVCDQLRDHGAEVAAVTGLRLDSYFSGPKIRWLRQRERRGVVTTTDTFLLHHLCGAYVTDATTASRTALMDLRSRSWSPAMGDLFTTDIGTLPQIVSNDAPVGQTTAFGRGPATVCGLAVDQQAALWAHRALDDTPVKATYGTGAFVLGIVDELNAPTRLATSVAWSVDDQVRYCCDGQVPSAGAALAWLARVGVIRDTVTALRDMPAAPDPDGPVFVPALAGLGAPEWSPRARGVLAALELATGAEALVGAVVDGVALAVSTILEALSQLRDDPIGSLQVDGSLTQSDAFCQRQADLTQTTVIASRDPDLTSRGVASMGARGAGLTDFEDTPMETTTRGPSVSASAAAAHRRRWAAARDLALSLGGDR